MLWSSELGTPTSDLSAEQLILHWSSALETATAAVRAGRAANTLSREAGTVELNRIRLEQEWLARFDWRTFGGGVNTSMVSARARALEREGSR